MALSHEEKKEIIVEAAREVFGKFGYKKTTMEDIAASLYRAKSSIYYYFKSKEDIFRAVIELETKRARRIIKEAIDREKTPENKLRAYFMTVIAFIRETISYYNFMQEEIIDILSFSNEMKEQHEHETVQVISVILKEGVDAGTFMVSDIQGTAEAVMMAFEGLYRPFYSSGELTDEKFEHLFNLVLYGIKKQ